MHEPLETDGFDELPPRRLKIKLNGVQIRDDMNSTKKNILIERIKKLTHWKTDGWDSGDGYKFGFIVFRLPKVQWGAHYLALSNGKKDNGHHEMFRKNYFF